MLPLPNRTPTYILEVTDEADSACAMQETSIAFAVFLHAVWVGLYHQMSLRRGAPTPPPSRSARGDESRTLRGDGSVPTLCLQDDARTLLGGFASFNAAVAPVRSVATKPHKTSPGA